MFVYVMGGENQNLNIFGEIEMNENDLKATNENTQYLIKTETEVKRLAEIMKSILENNVNDDKKISYLKTLEKIINGTFKITD